MNTLELTNSLELNEQNKLNLENEQKSFLQTNFGKVVNVGLEIGLKALLPDYIENDVIEIKDNLFEEGFSSALETTIDKVVDIGKNVVGLFTGNIESIGQAQEIVKEGGLLEKVSELVDKTLDKGEEYGIISNGISSLIKTGKDTLLNNVEKSVESNFENQIETLEKINTYIGKWQQYYEKEDFDNMEKQYEKITNKIEDVLPLENIIIKARQLENIHNLIKNNGKNFNLSQDELELANKLF